MSRRNEKERELAMVESPKDAAGPLAPGQRWSRSRKREVVLRLLRGESVEALSRELALPSYRLDEWRERALHGIDLALRDREGEPLQLELDGAMKRIGELTMQVELFRAKAGHAGPLVVRRSRR